MKLAACSAGGGHDTHTGLPYSTPSPHHSTPHAAISFSASSCARVLALLPSPPPSAAEVARRRTAAQPDHHPAVPPPAARPHSLARCEVMAVSGTAADVGTAWAAGRCEGIWRG